MPEVGHSHHYNAAARSLIGIPVWVGITFLLDSLGRAMEGMTGAAPGRSIASWPSYFILGHFLFSFLVALFITSRTWRFRFGCFAHLLPLTSIVVGIVPLFGRKRPGDLADGIVTLVIVYTIFFLPWMITWAKFILRGETEQAYDTAA